MYKQQSPIITFISWFLLVTVAIFILSIVLSAFRLINLPFYQFNRNIDRNVGIIDRVNNPDRCLAINKEFQELKTDILQVRDTQIPNSQIALESFKKGLPEDRTKWDFPTSQGYNQLNSQLLGQQQYLSTLQGKYEAFLKREDTAPCRDNLPLFINLK